jgi:hypothetical protein
MAELQRYRPSGDGPDHLIKTGIASAPADVDVHVATYGNRITLTILVSF